VNTGPFDLTGKLALVTGSSRGIGAAICLALAEAGADVVGVSRQGEHTETHRAVRAAGAQFFGVQADLSTTAGVDAVFEAVEALQRPLDILVNNAGIAARAPAERHTDAQWNDVIAVNLTAPFALTRRFGDQMLQRGQGKVVFLASMMTFQGGRDVVSYTASKSGVAGMARALANEWAGRGVNVNAIAPGYISTDLTAASHGDPDRHQAFVDRIPAGRWGRPEDLGGAAVFLSSTAADYVHGIVLPVDGGWLVR